MKTNSLKNTINNKFNLKRTLKSDSELLFAKLPTPLKSEWTKSKKKNKKNSINYVNILSYIFKYYFNSASIGLFRNIYTLNIIFRSFIKCYIIFLYDILHFKSYYIFVFKCLYKCSWFARNFLSKSSIQSWIWLILFWNLIEKHLLE